MSVFLIIVSLSLTMGTTGGAIRPTVTITPNWGNILYYDNVTLTCNVTSTEPEDLWTYQWYKDNQLILKDQQNFLICDSIVNDTGDYQCRVYGGDLSDPVFLNVTQTYVILQRPPSAIYEGDPLTLRCHHVNDFIAINTKFYKDDEEIQSSHTDHKLHIPNIDRSHSGLYKCTKRIYRYDHQPSDSEEYSDVFRLSVKGGAIRPAVTFTPNWGNILLFDSVNLTCNVTSTIPEEPRSYQWYKDNRLIHNDQQNLLMSPSRIDGTGDYQCRVNGGDLSYPVFLNVTHTYVILQRPPSAIYEGDPLTLRCHHVKDFIAINTKFYKDDEEIQSSHTDHELHIPNIDRSHSGQYKCTKQIYRYDEQPSAFEEYSDVFHLSVKELFSKPEIKVQDRVIKGSDLMVRCHTSLDPFRTNTELQFAFYRDGRPVQEFSVSDIYRVQSAQPEDFGNYICKVRTATDTVRKTSDELKIHIDYTVQNIIRLVLSGCILAAALGFIYFHNKW